MKKRSGETQQQALSAQDEYDQYVIRIKKNSLAAQGLPHHAQRFHHRYIAGWIAMLVEEFYNLIDGSDPRASLLYPLLFHVFETSDGKERSQQASIAPSAHPPGEEEEREEGAFDLADIDGMASNLQGYLDTVIHPFEG